ncbi:MAG TPA: hypothetical protein PLU50_08675, partial [Pseudobdellovibrionaceae bacterium]|nr:hypothetical protein [Pseudobdellovibrionaceae bacterium]
LLDAVDKDSLNFGYCGTQSGYPIRKNRAPCVTEDYVNLVYNAFQDVTDCMGIPQKLVLPKLLNESGFHINAMAPLRALDAEGKIIKTVLTPPFTEEQKKGRIIGGDAGVGQLTGSALRDINATINDWTVYINGSEKASCQRLKTYLGKIPSQENVHPEVENRCSLMSMPQNPVYSFILWGVLFNNNQASIRYAWKENNIAGLLEKNGFSATEEQMKRMRESLIILSYNAGPRLSLTLFKNWLESRVAQANQVAIKREDFDLSQNGSSASIRVRPNDEAKTVASLSPDEVESLTKEYANLIAKKEKQSSRAKAIAALGLDRLPFSVYLRIYRTGWSKGYLTYIKSFADTANNEVGKGVCVHEHFLSL